MNFFADENQSPIVNKDEKRLNESIEEENFLNQSRLSIGDTDEKDKSPKNRNFYGHQREHEGVKNKIAIRLIRFDEFDLFCNISADGDKKKQNVYGNSSQEVKILFPKKGARVQKREKS